MDLQNSVNRDLFNSEAQDLAVLAAEIAVRYNHSTIDVEHILLALLEHEGGIVSEILGNMGIETISIRYEINSLLEKNAPTKSTTGKLFISKELKILIDKAAVVGFVLGNKTLSSEHLFLAMFNYEDNSPITEILLAYKISKENVLATIKNIISETKRTDKKLKVFLCHSSGDKKIVKILYKQLQSTNADPWLDSEKLLPGQDWENEITKAVKRADIVIVCLSKKSINKSGYMQKELKYALNVADEKPEGSIFIIPLKLEECTVLERLSKWQWLNLYEDNAYPKLLDTLRFRAEQLGIEY